MPHGTAIEDWELGDLRRELEHFYTHHCRIESTSTADDEYGGTGETRTVTEDMVHCYVEGGVAHEQDRVLVGGVGAEREFFTISVPAFTPVKVGDWVVVYPNPGTGDGNLEVIVTAVVGPESHELERRILAYRIA